jgi:hypothetical protein
MFFSPEKINRRGGIRTISFVVPLYRFEKALPEIPPALPFSKEGELLRNRRRIPSTFSPFGQRRMKGDFTPFQKANMFPFLF